MNTKISNNIIITNPTENILNWIKENLIVDNPIYLQMKKMGKDDTIRWKHIPEKLNLYAKKYDDYVLPFGVLKSLWNDIKQFEYSLSFNKNEDISIKNAIPKFEMYDYQEKAIQEMIKAKGGVLVGQCGCGKTYMGIELIKRIGKKALWLCTTSDLLRQAKQDMQTLYPDIKIGITTEGKLEIGEDVTIATIQTLTKIDPDLYRNEFEVIVCDECAHVATAPTQMKIFGELVSKIPARYKFGLTATPTRSDGMIRAMYAYIGVDNNGNFAPTYKIEKAAVKTIPAQHIKYSVATIKDPLDMMKIYDTSGMLSYNNLIAYLSENENRTMQIIENIENCAKEGRKQVVLANRVSHCEDIVRILQAKGLNAVLVVGKVSAKQRNNILKQITPWDIIVSTYSLLKEGVSINELDTLHLATPIKDKGMIVQCAGRIERYVPDKKQPIVYDYVDSDIPYCEHAYLQRKRSLIKRF